MAKLVQYVIVNGDIVRKLNWPLGAVIAQCCHATTAVNHLHRDDPATVSYFNDLDNMHKVVLEVNSFAIYAPYLRTKPFILSSHRSRSSFRQKRKTNCELWLTR